MLSLLLKLYAVQGLFVKYERATGALSNRPQVSMIIWFYQLSWQCKLANRSDEGLTLETSAFESLYETSAFESLYGG